MSWIRTKNLEWNSFVHFTEVNDVKLVGTLISDSFALQSGTKSLTLRTNDTPTKQYAINPILFSLDFLVQWTYVVANSISFSFSSNHNIHLKTEANFTAGQRIYVTGKLRSGPIRTNDGKAITASTVKAAQLYVLDNECGSKSASIGDRNHVELLGNISSEVTKKSDHSTFSVATHYNST